jgi:hypothetical protein
MNHEIGKEIRKFFGKERRLTFPEIALIGGTRAALGAGVGLLLADKLKGNSRRAVGLTLFLVGAVTTIPLVVNVIARDR